MQGTAYYPWPGYVAPLVRHAAIDVHEDLLGSMFRNGARYEITQSGIPVDACLVEIDADYQPGIVRFVYEHPSFPEVPDWQPTLLAPATARTLEPTS